MTTVALKTWNVEYVWLNSRKVAEERKKSSLIQRVDTDFIKDVYKIGRHSKLRILSNLWDVQLVENELNELYLLIKTQLI